MHEPVPLTRFVLSRQAWRMEPSRRNDEIELKIAGQLYEHAPAAIFATMVNSALVAFVYRDLVPSRVLVPWLAISLVFLAFRYLLSRRARKKGLTLENYRIWLRAFIVTAFVSGAIFGAPGVLFIAPDRIAHNAFLYFLMGGMFAGSMGAFAIKKSAFFAYAAPLFLPITVHFFLLGGELHTVMATLALIFIAMMVSLIVRMNKSLVGAFELSIQNAHLAAEMKDLNDDLQQANVKLTQLSLYDSLTNTKNRRFLFDVLKPETERFAFTKKKLALSVHDERGPAVQVYGIFIIDIDHFKRINDTYGHACGDEILKGFVGVLRGMIRKDDVLVRWGGEEFVVVLKRTSTDYMHVFARKVVATICETDFRVKPDTVLKETCSVGYTAFPFLPTDPLALSLEQCIEIADRALYRAKNTGRNKAVFAEYDPPDEGDNEGHGRLFAENLDEALALKLLKLS